MPPPLNVSTFTAGAIPVKNDKGEFTMQKVKVTRYVTGKRPTFAPSDESDVEDEDGFLVQEGGRDFGRRSKSPERGTLEDAQYTEEDVKDPRLQRLQRARSENADSDEETDRIARHHQRVIAEPEIVSSGSGVMEGVSLGRIRLKVDDDSDEDEEEIANRRALLRERAQQRVTEEDVAVKVEESDESEEDSEYEEGTDSEDESNPRLKPVFVRKQDRISLQEKKAEEKKALEDEKKAKKLAEERKIEARRMVEQEVKRDMQDQLKKTSSEMDDTVLEIPIVIDNEDPEAEYEAWKVRELTRMKRDRDERDAFLKEQAEVERLRGLTEEQRLRELANNPREVTNKSQKGKMKFLQKYYHRGVFYLDQDETVLKRDYTAPTLEDHHDKAVLPKVMQVKNFGRAGRTKYTHLVDQDTTKFDSAWTEQTTLNMKFHTGKAGGTKQVFEKPSAKRRKV